MQVEESVGDVKLDKIPVADNQHVVVVVVVRDLDLNAETSFSFPVGRS